MEVRETLIIKEQIEENKPTKVKKLIQGVRKLETGKTSVQEGHISRSEEPAVPNPAGRQTRKDRKASGLITGRC